LSVVGCNGNGAGVARGGIGRTMARRSTLKRCAQQIADRISARGYSFWSQRADLWVFQCMFEGSELQVEVEVLESTEEYALVMVAVDDGGLLWGFFPAATSFRVDNPRNQVHRASP